MAVSALLVFLLGFDLVTFNRVPTVWCDDVSFTEPAINLLLHGSYTTTVWQFQPPNTFPSVNCPLYSQLLVGWLWVFGTTLLAVRAFNYFLMGLASLLFWLLLHGFKLVQSARWRIALVTVFHLGYGISFAYRCSRPDTLGLVLTLGLALLFAVKASRLRNAGLLAVSAGLPWVSLNVGLYAGLACFWGLFVVGRPRWRQAVIVWIGLILGVLSVGWFLSAKGVLGNFIAGASHVVGKHYAASGGAGVATRVRQVFAASWPNYFLEYSTAVLLLGTLLLLIFRWRELRAGAHGRAALCCALVLFSTPLVFNFVGHYAFYYSYTIFTPALILFACVGPKTFEAEKDRGFAMLPAALAVFTLAGAGLAGLPLRLAVTSYFARVTPRAEIQRRVDSFVTPQDVVFSDDSAFFEVKQRAGVVYTRWSSSDFITTRVPGRSLTQAEKDRVNKLVIRAGRAEFFTNYFGGHWEAATEPFGDSTRWDRVKGLPVLRAKVAAYLDQPQTWRYPLQFFRRVPAEIPPARDSAARQ